MISVVLDTNVLISGMINAFGPPGRIVDLVRAKRVEIVVDDRILTEYGDVLKRPKFRSYFQASDIRAIMIFLERDARYVVPTLTITNLPDPDDAPFLEVAITVGVPLVTGNINDFPPHLRHNATVSTPADFLRNRFETNPCL